MKYTNKNNEYSEKIKFKSFSPTFFETNWIFEDHPNSSYSNKFSIGFNTAGPPGVGMMIANKNTSDFGALVLTTTMARILANTLLDAANESEKE